MKHAWLFVTLFVVSIFLIYYGSNSLDLPIVIYLGLILKIVSIILFIWHGLPYDAKPRKGYLSNWFCYQIPIRLAGNIEWVNIFFPRTILLLIFLAAINWCMLATIATMHYVFVAFLIVSITLAVIYSFQNYMYNLIKKVWNILVYRTNCCFWREPKTIIIFLIKRYCPVHARFNCDIINLPHSMCGRLHKSKLQLFLLVSQNYI